MNPKIFSFGWIRFWHKTKKQAEHARRSEGAKRGWVTRREKAAKNNPQNELPL